MSPGDGTIAAVATPAGRGGLGTVRISGPRAESIGSTVFRPSRPRPRAAHARAIYGLALGPGGTPLDRGYLTFFRAPRSFTGEDTAEISVHGSPYLLGRLLDATLDAGARPAEPGEFTYRAFRNGRLDLTQAEAVADLIEARSEHQARVAFQQAEGALSRRLQGPREELLDLIARLEASLEFSEEGDTRIDPADVVRRLDGIAAAMRTLVDSYRRGRMVRRGATMVLAGAPNVGKSSLFNRLVGGPRAIVTPVPGTTRDLLTESVEIGGVPVRLVDTAGHAKTGDPVEAEGVRRAEEARRDADLVLVILDRSRRLQPDESQLLRGAPPDAILVLNKSDLASALDAAAVRRRAAGRAVVEVSARTGDGIDRLLASTDAALSGGASGGDVPLTRRRQHREVVGCLEALGRAREAANRELGEELILADLEAARDALGRLTGGLDLDQIYDRIFSTFCIGK